MSRYEITFKDVLQAVSNGPGHVAVLAHFAGDIFGAALQAHSTGQIRHVDCPFPHRHGKTGGKSDFRLKREFDRDGSAICSCGRYRIFDLLTECGRFNSRTDAMLAVADYLGMRASSQEERARVAEELARKRESWEKTRSEWEERLAEENKPEKIEQRAASLRKLWMAGVSISDKRAEPARAYFAKRGVPHWKDLPAMKFVERCAYRNENGTVSHYPAIISAVVTPERKAMSIHRIYITKNGDKAPVEKCKRLMPSVTAGGLPGCFIPVCTAPNSRTLNVCEGIETACAVLKMTCDNVWSCVSSSMLQSVKIPRAHFDVVRIWADKDVSGAGEHAAKLLANRLLEEGFIVQYMLPVESIPEDKKSLDWEDVYVSHFKGMRGSFVEKVAELAQAPVSVTEPFVIEKKSGNK